jgi:hypothetical protein
MLSATFLELMKKMPLALSAVQISLRQGLFGNLELNQFEDNNATVNFITQKPFTTSFASHMV